MKKVGIFLLGLLAEIVLAIVFIGVVVLLSLGVEYVCQHASWVTFLHYAHLVFMCGLLVLCIAGLLYNCYPAGKQILEFFKDEEQ